MLHGNQGQEHSLLRKGFEQRDSSQNSSSISVPLGICFILYFLSGNFLFFCSLHERIYSHEYLSSLYVAIYSASSSVLKFLRNSFHPNLGSMSIREQSAKPIKAGPHSTNTAAKGHSCGLQPLLR